MYASRRDNLSNQTRVKLPSSHSHCTQSVKWCLVDFEHFPLIWLDDLVPFYSASLVLEITSQLNLYYSFLCEKEIICMVRNLDFICILYLSNSRAIFHLI